jgi:dTDP-4-amino-4,6-dideoxygalactose transaminase
VPFNDLTRSTAEVRAEVDRAISRVLERGWFILGDEGEAFEREFAELCGAAHAVGVGSGTDAIELALRALALGRGDEVVTQANTCVPTISGIERAGATAVLCDVEPAAGTMDPESLRGAIGPRTRAVVPVHLYGQCADVDAIDELARDRGVDVVEDCAQAHGATLRGRHAGTIGRLGCFSFYPTKNLGALGDGGLVITQDDTLADEVRRLRTYGQTDRYHHVERGVNSRLDEVQAAVLRAKLPRLQAWNRRRDEIAAVYEKAVRETPVRTLERLPDRTHVFHLFVVTTPNRPAFREHLAAQGIQTLIHYPLPVHQQPAYKQLADGPVPLTNAEQLCEQVVSLPIYPELRNDEVERVAAGLRSFAG